jgi:hypothetical protein
MSNVQNPFTSMAPVPPPAPPPPAAGIPSLTIHRPSPVPAAYPPAIPKRFRRNFFDRQDPFEAAGVVMRRFTFSGNYELPPGESPQTVADEIRSEIHADVAANPAAAQFDVVDFNDARFRHEPGRRFLVLHTTTIRRTPVTINVYFQSYGSRLYYSVRSYAVPRLSLLKLASGLLLSLGFLPYTLPFLLVGSLLGPLFFVIPLLFSAVLFAAIFRTFTRSIVAGDRFSIALRKQFPGPLDRGTFDDDDIIGFLKINLSMTLGVISRVLEQHGVSTEELRTIIQNLHTTNINTGGGGIFGAIFGGSGNSVSGAGS